MKKEETTLVMNALDFLKCDAESSELAIQHAKEELTKLLYMSMRKSNSKIDIFSFCAKDKLRPVMNCVFYDTDNQVAVASDGHVLLVSKSDYVDYTSSEYAHTSHGYIINKKGECFHDAYPGEQYPNYQAVFPHVENCRSFSVDCEKLRECIKAEKLRRKIASGKPLRSIKIEGVYFSLDRAEFIAKFTDGTFYARENDRYTPIMYISNDDNYKALFMPVLSPDHECPVGEDINDYFVDYAA